MRCDYWVHEVHTSMQNQGDNTQYDEVANTLYFAYTIKVNSIGQKVNQTWKGES